MAGQWLDVPQAQEILCSAVPNARVLQVVRRTGGQLSAVYEVRCTGSPGAVIVKLYATQWAWKLAKEVDVYQILVRHGVGPVPEILHAQPDPGAFSAAFIVMTLLPGQPLSEISADLDRSDIARIYRQMGAALSAVHRIKEEAYGYRVTAIVDPESDNAAYMTRQFAKKLREFRSLGGDPALHDEIEAHVARRAVLFANSAGPVLCHNDFHEGNVLVARNAEASSAGAGLGAWTVKGFIDVENAFAADPLLDLAKTDYYSIKGDASKRAAFLDGYGQLPEDWLERLCLYRLYHALELWDWFASIENTAPLVGIADDLRDMASGP
jgi:hygromycin-B 7''-O-kinase